MEQRPEKDNKDQEEDIGEKDKILPPVIKITTLRVSSLDDFIKHKSSYA